MGNNSLAIVDVAIIRSVFQSFAFLSKAIFFSVPVELIVLSNALNGRIPNCFVFIERIFEFFLNRIRIFFWTSLNTNGSAKGMQSAMIQSITCLELYLMNNKCASFDTYFNLVAFVFSNHLLFLPFFPLQLVVV